MKIPKRLNIKGADYRIYIVDRTRLPSRVAGLCSAKDRTIHLASDMPKDQLEQVFLHECIHAVHDEGGICQANVSDDVLEILSEQISTFIVDKFKLTLKK
jgi:hypothetical protein